MCLEIIRYVCLKVFFSPTQFQGIGSRKENKVLWSCAVLLDVVHLVGA